MTTLRKNITPEHTKAHDKWNNFFVTNIIKTAFRSSTFSIICRKSLGHTKVTMVTLWLPLWLPTYPYIYQYFTTIGNQGNHIYTHTLYVRACARARAVYVYVSWLPWLPGYLFAVRQGTANTYRGNHEVTFSEWWLPC